MQPTQLYLDTARLGQMSPRACVAHVDFACMVAEEGGSKLFERFLRQGVDSCRASVQARFPGLMSWQGIGHLKANLRTLAGSKPDLPVLMVNRSTQLMKFAARLLFQQCRNVLATDLGWPPYQEILGHEARLAGRPVTVAAVHDLLCRDRADESDLVDAIQTRFQEAGCDGLFLTAVSHQGIRLPVERLVRTLEAMREVRAVVIDGAQDFCHASAELNNEYCDLYLAGCHKWLNGFHPMGLGFYGRQRSVEMIDTVVKRLVESGELDDPLLKFTTQIETAKLDGETETVNLIPLFTCQGAAVDALERPLPLATILRQRKANLREAVELAAASGWLPVQPAEPFCTGILLLQAEREKTRRRSAEELRDAFAEEGLALTSYDGGFVRLSMPPARWQPPQFALLEHALVSIA